MKKKLVKLSALLIALSMILTFAFVGCAKNDDGVSAATTKSGTAASATTSGEPVTLKLLTQDTWDPDYSWGSNYEYPAIKYIEEKTNVKIEFEVTTGGENYDNLLKTRFAAGVNLPDIAYLGWNMDPIVATGYATQGIIIPLNDLIDQYGPDIKKAITETVPETVKDLTAPDGKIYWLADTMKEETSHIKIAIRNDWLKKVGINELPDTTDEFFNALKLFHDNDVNGDGKNNEIFQPAYFGAVTIALGDAFGVQYGNIDANIRIGAGEDGKVYLSWLQPGSKDFLQYLNRMYKDGIIDPDLPIITGEKINQRKAEDVVASTSGWPTQLDYLNGQVKAAGAQPDYRYMPVIKGPNGDWGNFRFAYGAQGPKVVITKDCKNPEAAMRFWNFFFTPEFITMYKYGLEGITYELVNGKPKMIESYVESTKDPNAHAAAKLGLAAWSSFVRLTFSTYENTLAEAIDKGSPFAQPKEYEPEKIAVEGPQSQDLKLGIPSLDDLAEFERIGTEFATYINEMTIKFFLGQESFENWDNFVAKANELGGKEYLTRAQLMYDRYTGK